MNTFVLLGLAVVLVLFLLRSRRRRAGGDETPSTPKATRSFGRRGRRSEPEPASEPFPFASAPAPFAAPSVETLGSAAPPPSRPFPAPAPADWTQSEMIVEPGWPLPGEISGAWAGDPQRTTSPVSTLERTTAHSAGPETAATAVVDDTAGTTSSPAQEWQMPAIALADPPPEAPTPLGEVPPGPAWTPGAIEEAPAWPAGPAWSPDASADQAPTGAWTAPSAADDGIAFDGEPGAGTEAPAAPAEELALPAWRPEMIDAVPAREREASTGAPVSEDPAPVIEEPVDPLAPATAFAPAFEPVPEISFARPALDEPAVAVGEDLDTQSAAVAELVPSVLSALRPLVRVSDHVGVTPRMLVVVGVLAERSRSIGELSSLLGVSRPVVSDISTRLENAGLTRRERDEDDRRRVRLVLTARGRRMHEETADVPPTETVADALSRMDPAERDALVRGLRALSRSASA